MSTTTKKEFIILSDFDQTLSFNDSGQVLAEMMGIPDFHGHVRRLADTHLVQQGGELAYLLLHDPAFKEVRRHHLSEAGKRVRLKKHIQLLTEFLDNIDGCHFAFYVVSAAPQEIVEYALKGILPADHIFASQLEFDGRGRVTGISSLRAGYGKVAILDRLRGLSAVGHNHLVYVGDGSSDVHVMLHVNRLGGLTIAVSENRYLAQIAKRSVLGDDALSILVPIMEEILSWDASRIRAFFERHGFILREWEKVQTDTLNIVRSMQELDSHPAETPSAEVDANREEESSPDGSRPQPARLAVSAAAAPAGDTPATRSL